MPTPRSPGRIAAVTKVAVIQRDVVWEIDPMGLTVFGDGDRAAVLSAEVDPGAVRATRAESAVSFPFRPDHENTTLRDDVFTWGNSCIR